MGHVIFPSWELIFSTMMRVPFFILDLLYKPASLSPKKGKMSLDFIQLFKLTKYN